VIAALLLFSYGYDLLSALYPERTSFLSPQYRLWTWLLFYLTGQLSATRIAEWISRKMWSGRGCRHPVYLSLHLVLRAPLLRPVQGGQKRLYSHRLANLHSDHCAGDCGERRALSPQC
jgi:hypothetical protein